MVFLQSVRIVALACLDLPVMGKAGNQLEIADDPRGVVQIAASALRAGIQPVLADVAAGIAQRVGYIEGQVIAAGANRRIQQKQILLFGQMLVQIDMAGAAAVQIPGEGFAVEALGLCSKNSVNATSVTKSEISRFRSRRPLPPDPYCSAPTQPPPLAAAWPWQVIGKNAKLNRRRDTFVSEISEFRHRRRD